MGAHASPAPQPGLVDPLVAAEFPGLRLRWVTIGQRPGPSPPAVVKLLKDLSNRYRGAGVVSMRTKAVPQAYRTFFRQIGLDPDVRRVPSEEVAVTRLLRGGFHSVDVITDACLVALIETGVPVWALDAARVNAAGLGIRVAGGPEPGSVVAAGPEPGSLVAGGPEPGSLVVADERGVCAGLFEDPMPERGVGTRTERVTLFAIAVDGVPEIHVEEALWCALEVLGGRGG